MSKVYEYCDFKNYGETWFGRLKNKTTIEILKVQFNPSTANYTIYKAFANYTKLFQEYNIGYVSNYGEVASNPSWQECLDIEWDTLYGENYEWQYIDTVSEWFDLSKYIKNLFELQSYANWYA